MIVNLNTVVPDKLVCPEGERRIEHCDKYLPNPYIERRARPNPIAVLVPVSVPVPVRHGGTCKCVDNAKKVILDLTSPQIALMEPGEKCEAKDLFERECWDSLSHAQQIEVGKCIV